MPAGAGSVTVRILPAAPDSSFFIATRIHNINGKSLHCPRTTNGKRWAGPCPVCEWLTKLWPQSLHEGPERQAAMQAEYRRCKAVERFYYNCIVRGHEDEGPKILSIGKSLHSKLILAVVGNTDLNEPPLGDVSDFVKGRDFKIIKTLRGSGAQTYPNYDQSKFLEVSATGKSTDTKAWMQNLHDLAKLRNVKSYEEIAQELAEHRGLVPQFSDSAPGEASDVEPAGLDDDFVAALSR